MADLIRKELKPIFFTVYDHFYVTRELEEIDEVIAALRPEGLYLVVSGVEDAENAGRLLKKLGRWT